MTSSSGAGDSRAESGQQPQWSGVEIRKGPFSWGMLQDGWVYLLVDCSGSMAGDKMEQAKKGAAGFAKDAIAKGYSAGLIEFYGIANHLCEPTKDVAVLQPYIDGLEAKKASKAQAFLAAFRRGVYGTNVSEAIRIAQDRLNELKGLKAIVLVTDGQANGPGDPDASLKRGESAKKDGIDIITIGTDDADQDFLKKLASRTELGMKVARDQLQQAIVSSANLLPGGN